MAKYIGLCDKAVEFVKYLSPIPNPTLGLRAWESPKMDNPIREVQQAIVKTPEGAELLLTCLETYVHGIGTVKFYEWTRDPVLANGCYSPQLANYWWEPCPESCPQSPCSTESSLSGTSERSSDSEHTP